MSFDWRKLKDPELVEHVIRQHDRLKKIKKPHEPLWDLETKIFLPIRHDMAQVIKPGEQFGISIYDENPAATVRKFAVGFTGVTVERNAGDEWWLGFETPKKSLMKSDAIKDYMQDSAEQISYGYGQSTFYREFPECMKDAAVMMGTMTTSEDLVRDRVVFRNRDPRNHYIGIDMNGDIDIDDFELNMTAKTMLEQFGEKNVPPAIVDQAKGTDKKDPFTEYKVIHTICKNGSVRVGSLDNTDMEYISIYVIEFSDPTTGKDKWVLEKKGVPSGAVNIRLGTPTVSGYPISLAGYALTAATKGNMFSRNDARASHLMVNPPRKASESLRDALRKSKLDPGSTTFGPDSGEWVLEYLTTKIDVNGVLERILKCDDAVNDIFFVSFLEMLTRRDASVKTLGEIYQMLAEMLRLMGPVVQATEDDGLEPSTNAIWRHEERAGRMPDPPDELLEYMAEQGRPAADGTKKKIHIKSKYNGELAKLKRSLPQSKATEEQLGFAKACLDVFPGSVQIVKSRMFLERALVSRGMPMDELKSDEELAKEDAALVAKQQRAEQMEMAERAAKMTPALTKDAVDPNSPAAQLAGAVR